MPEKQPQPSRLWTAESLRPASQIEAVLKTDSLEILTGKANPKLARAIGDKLGYLISVDEPVTLFADGEINTRIARNLRRKRVVIIQSTSRSLDDEGNIVGSVNDAIQELCLMSSAAQRASADEVTAVIAYYGYERQDRKDRSRAPISGADVAQQLITAGVDRILTMDLHAEQMMGAVGSRYPWDNIYARAVLLPEIEKRDVDNLVVVSPDAGGGKRAEAFSHLLGGNGDIAFIHKTRPGANESISLRVVGDVAGRDVLLVDDLIDTAGTITHGADLLKQCGARRIMVAATHGLFSGPALERINNSAIDEMFITDTIDQPRVVIDNPRITVVSVAPLLAEAILRIHTGESLGELIPAINGKLH